jgi:Na+/H+ antiporter NhaB
MSLVHAKVGAEVKHQPALRIALTSRSRVIWLSASTCLSSGVLNMYLAALTLLSVLLLIAVSDFVPELV